MKSGDARRKRKMGSSIAHCGRAVTDRPYNILGFIFLAGPGAACRPGFFLLDPNRYARRLIVAGSARAALGPVPGSPDRSPGRTLDSGSHSVEAEAPFPDLE